MMQREISRLSDASAAGMFASMEESETFRRQLLRLMAEKGLKAATLSKLAGLNPRAVKDIEEGKVSSPRLSTVIALAHALEQDPAEMMGLGRRVNLRADLAEYLSRYSEDEQEQLLKALHALGGPRA